MGRTSVKPETSALRKPLREKEKTGHGGREVFATDTSNTGQLSKVYKESFKPLRQTTG